MLNTIIEQVPYWRNMVSRQMHRTENPLAPLATVRDLLNGYKNATIPEQRRLVKVWFRNQRALTRPNRNSLHAIHYNQPYTVRELNQCALFVFIKLITAGLVPGLRPNGNFYLPRITPVTTNFTTQPLHSIRDTN